MTTATTKQTHWNVEVMKGTHPIVIIDGTLYLAEDLCGTVTLEKLGTFDGPYEVKMYGDVALSCTCKDYKYRGSKKGICKHGYAAGVFVRETF